MNILGISAFYHDSAAALVRDGAIVAAAQEERFTRRKHDAGLPIHAVQYCLKAAEIALDELDFVVFYDKPLLKFERLIETYLAFAPRGLSSFKTAMPLWIKEKLFQKELLRKQLQPLGTKFDWRSRLLFCEHHLSHAASAYFPSPFDEALVLTLDGVGEWATTSVATGKGHDLVIEREIAFPHSLGLLYAAFTYYTGFRINSGEYKVMGLAPYGEPKFRQIILDHLIDLKPDGTFRLNMDYFDFCTGLTMTSDKFDRLFGGAARRPEAWLTQREMDLAASIQSVTEEIMLRLTSSLSRQTGHRNLCLAGGVALNCVANGKILKAGHFENIWIQPASGDAGGALGAALAVHHGFLGNQRTALPGDAMQGSYLGPEYTAAEIASELKAAGATFEFIDDEDALLEITVDALAGERAVGWFNSRMEFGPRALGARSILADPRSPAMQKTLNLKVKYRESFRPFAPSILREDVADWFELEADSPYMLLVAGIRNERRRPMTDAQQTLFGIDKLNVPRSDIPAVTHVDFSARVQTVHQETNPRYHALLTKFKQRTGCPVLVNTSFNVRGEPIVCTPTDAFRCFMGTELDLLVVGNAVLRKEKQHTALKLNYEKAFELD
jgi:carbamoyltransferase